MAILLRGKTKCPICGRVIQADDEAALFPHFILNEIDPLFPLSDAACHMTCLGSDPIGRSMVAAAEQFLARTGPGKRRCAVCGEEVLDPDDYLLIGYLADSKQDPLNKFNYTHLHKSHIPQWKQADEFLALARTTLAGGKWRGPVLSDLIREVEAGKLL